MDDQNEATSSTPESENEPEVPSQESPKIDAVPAMKGNSGEIDEILSKLKADGETATTVLAALQANLDDSNTLLKQMRVTESGTEETYRSLQEHLTNASSIVSNLSEQVSKTESLLSQASQISANINELNTNCIAQRDSIAAVSAEANRIQSEISSTASRVSQNEQTAITAATNATAQQQTATDAAAKAAQNQIASASAFTDVQGHVSQIAGLLQQATANAETTKSATAEADKALAAIRQSTENANKHQTQIEAVRRTVEATGLRIAEADISAKEASNRIAALEPTIVLRNEELAKQLANWHEQYTELKKEIEGLLPGATSAGLAVYFREQKESYDKPKLFWGIVLGTGIALLAIGGLMPVKSPWDAKVSTPWEGILSIIMDVVHKSPLYLPGILLVYFAATRFSAADRIQQDYAYKQRIASAFEGFKAQFANITVPTGIESPLTTLCNKMLVIIGRHPARFYDPRHREEPFSPSESTKVVPAVAKPSIRYATRSGDDTLQKIVNTTDELAPQTILAQPEERPDP